MADLASYIAAEVLATDTVRAYLPDGAQDRLHGEIQGIVQRFAFERPVINELINQMSEMKIDIGKGIGYVVTYPQAVRTFNFFLRNLDLIVGELNAAEIAIRTEGIEGATR